MIEKVPDSDFPACEHTGTQQSEARGETVNLESGLDRGFRARHVSMIAISGAIGTGLIIGSGSALAHGGPASLFISYTLIGAVVYFLMTAVGEMATMLPMDQGFAGYATRFVSHALGFATGWNYFFKYAIVLPNNLTAAALIIQYWRPDLNVAIFIAALTVAIIAINVLHVSVFGEAEFWMATVKLLVITMLVLTCFVISVGGQPSGDRIGFRYWTDPGAFGSYLVGESSTGRFLGFWSTIVQACFTYTGTEVVGAAFGETPNPKRNVPLAIRQTLARIVCFYILGALVIGMAVPYTSDLLLGAIKSKTSAEASPFVVAVKLAKIPALPDVVNGCLLVFVISAANSDIYIGSRTLYGLAKDGLAPRLLERTRANGVPLIGIAFTSLFTCLGYMNATKSASTVFGYLVSLVTVFGTLNWLSVLISYTRFVRGMRAQGISRQEMPFRGPLQPYGAYFALAMTSVIIFFNGYDAFIPHFKPDRFVLCYIGVVVYCLNVAVWTTLKRTRIVPLDSMDLSSGRLYRD